MNLVKFRRLVNQLEKRSRRRRRWQKGGVLPLAALVPALVAGGKALGAAVAGSGASYAVNKVLDTVTKRKKKRRKRT